MGVQQWIDRDIKLEDSAYNNGNTRVEAKHMYEYIKKNKIKKEKIYIDSMFHKIRWSSLNAIDMAEHWIRIQKTDLRYPIVIHYEGSVVDGYHRIVKALVENRKYIRAYRIDIDKLQK